MALKSGDKFVVALLRNGESLALKGENCGDVCTMPISHHSGWATVTLITGRQAQIWAEDISAIYEEVVE